MGSRFRFILLPLFGAIAALLAFKFAAPYEATLNRPNMNLLDPAAQFTFGTAWGDVNRIAFGALLCGLFSFGLAVGRKSCLRVLAATASGTVLGGLINFVTDSTSDVIGLGIAKYAGMLGNLIASVAWCVLVPVGISAAILLAMGPTPERFRRACVGTVFAALASGAAQTVGTIFGGKALMQHLATTMASGMGGSGGGGASLEAFIPVWRSQEIAVGIALGMVLAFADQRVRVGTLRLIVGTNEAREWSLDHTANRIGSAEGLEIPIGRHPGVEPLHAAVVRQGGRFVVQNQGGPVLLNGAQVDQAELKHYDTIQLGTATIQFLEGNAVGAHSYQATTLSSPKQSVPFPIPPQPTPHAVAAEGVLIDAVGGEYHLPLGQYGIGRDADNAICLSREPSVSRHHAKILVTTAGTQLSDMGSTNGTKVNGQPLHGETPLRPGDRLQFGCVEFTVGPNRK